MGTWEDRVTPRGRNARERHSSGPSDRSTTQRSRLKAEALLRGLIAHGPSIIGQHTRHHGRCVLASRIGLDLLQRHGIEAVPMAVQVAAMNRAWIDWAARHGTLDEFRTSGARIVSNAPRWRRLCGASRVPSPDRIAYHVVLMLPEHNAILDLDVRQLARPAYGLTPPDALLLAWNEHRASTSGTKATPCRAHKTEVRRSTPLSY